MKKLTLLALAIVMAWRGVAHPQVLVDPYLRKDGVYVDGQYRSNTEGNPYNNWFYPGNVNPYTGKQATADPNRYSEQHQKRNEQESVSVQSVSVSLAIEALSSAI